MCTSTTSYASHSLIVICCIEKCVKYYLHKMLYTKYIPTLLIATVFEIETQRKLKPDKFGFNFKLCSCSRF